MRKCTSTRNIGKVLRNIGKQAKLIGKGPENIDKAPKNIGKELNMLLKPCFGTGPSSSVEVLLQD